MGFGITMSVRGKSVGSGENRRVGFAVGDGGPYAPIAS
jgi:hypothetical protein